MKRSSIVLVMSTLLLGGCASSAGEAAAPPASVAESGSAQGELPPTTTDDGFIKKQINEVASVGCNVADSDECDVVFRLVELERGYECNGQTTLLSGGPLPDGYETLLIRIDAEMAESFDYEQSDNVLHSQHLGVIDKDGYYVQSPDLVFCPELESDLNRLYPGTKARGAQVLAIPNGTEIFRLGMLVGNGGWEWEIPQ